MMAGEYDYKKVYDNMSRGIGLMLIIAGILMVVFALVLESRKSIRAIEGGNYEH